MSNVWSIGIFLEGKGFDIINDRPSHLSAVFNPKKIRKSRSHIHTYADPFLFVYNRNLYLFAEIQEVNGKGYINCWQSSDMFSWTDCGAVLKANHHLSYPYIFQSKQGELYLIPESSEAGFINLYSFLNFPNGLIKVKTILKGNYADSNIWESNGTFFLLTTNMSTGNLELFYTDDLIQMDWQKHEASPITNDPMINRNGGGFINVNEQLYRIAQNTTQFYGSGIVLLEVLLMNKIEYTENIVIPDYRLVKNYNWQKQGRHHLNYTQFNGQTVIAMDGLQKDFFLNKFINLGFKLYK